VLAGLAARSAHSTKRAGPSTVAAPPAPARPTSVSFMISRSILPPGLSVATSGTTSRSRRA